MNTELLSQMTTTGVGGPAGTLVRATTEQEIVSAVQGAASRGDELLIVAGGSNLVIDDAGYPGTVLHIESRGVSHCR